MKNFTQQAATACLLALLSACGVRTTAADWEGVWEYSANLGRSAGGSPIFMQYRLTVAQPGTEPRASLVVRGFQTDETLMCDVDASADRLTLVFRSYGNGKTVNQYGVAEHRVGDRLVTLSRSRDSTESGVTTEWQALGPPGEAMPRTGSYFHRVAEQPGR